MGQHPGVPRQPTPSDWSKSDHCNSTTISHSAGSHDSGATTALRNHPGLTTRREKHGLCRENGKTSWRAGGCGRDAGRRDDGRHSTS